MRFRAARPVLRKSDDTHIQRATTFRSHPLASLSVERLRFVLPSRHVSRAGLACGRQAFRVSSSVALVAAVGLSLAALHWLVVVVSDVRSAANRFLLRRRHFPIINQALQTNTHIDD